MVAKKIRGKNPRMIWYVLLCAWKRYGWCANPAYHDSFRPLPPFMLQNLVIWDKKWTANSAIAPDPQRAGLSNGPLPVKDDLWTVQARTGYTLVHLWSSKLQFVRQAGTLPNKVCAKMGHTAFHAPYNMRTVKSSTNHLVFFRGRGGVSVFRKNHVEPLLDLLGVDLQDLCWQPIHWLLQGCQGQHHHLLESLAGFTNYTKYPKGGLNH